jgi:hypothetical protein
VGTPNKRWIEAVEEDAKMILGIRNWKREAMGRQGWTACIYT